MKKLLVLTAVVMLTAVVGCNPCGPFRRGALFTAPACDPCCDPCTTVAPPWAQTEPAQQSQTMTTTRIGSLFSVATFRPQPMLTVN